MTQTILPMTWLNDLDRLPAPLTPSQLGDLTAGYAARPDLWMPLVRHDPSSRWYERLLLTGTVEVWLIGWTPGQGTTVHDHGGAAGAMTVLEGSLVEDEFDLPGPERRRRLIHAAGASAGFGERHVHRIANEGSRNATSLHAYSPPGHSMRHYAGPGENPATVEELLSRARARLRRLSAREAADAQSRGALLVDIRPGAQREQEGSIPGALVVGRNVLEWRLDPTSRWRIPEADAHDREIVVFCSEGYTSSLAAAALQDLGLVRATDLVGGFRAWAAAGLATQPDTTQPGSVLSEGP